MLAKRLTLESTRNRAIRVHLGEQLRAYYDCMERTPTPERLAELIERPGSMAGSAKQQRNKDRVLAAPSRSTPACGAFRLWKGEFPVEPVFSVGQILKRPVPFALVRQFPFTPLDPCCGFFHLLPVINPFRHDDRPHA